MTFQAHYFSHKDIEKLTTIEFDKEVWFANDVPSVGGEYNGLKWRDKNLLITFPNGKVLARPGRPPGREILPEIDMSKVKIKTFDPNEINKPKKK